MLKKVDVVVFDFDGTLSGLDSNVEFAKYCFRLSKIKRGIAPFLITIFIYKLIAVIYYLT